MQQPGRKYQSVTLSSVEGYRYGFNGKEKDKDINSLTAYDYGFRIYNPAIGKFLSVDPLANAYPWNSSYSFAEGDPINFIDLDGLEKNLPISKVLSGNLYDVYNAPVVDNVCNGCQAKMTRQQEVKSINSVIVRQQQDFLIKAISGKVVLPKEKTNSKPQATLQPLNTAYYAEQQRKFFREEFEKKKRIQNAIMDPGAAAVVASTYVAAREYVFGILDHGYGIYEGIKDRDGWKIGKNTVLLGVDVISIAPLKIPLLNREVQGLWLGSSKSIGLGADLATIKSLQNLKPKNGWFDVVVHGDDFYVGSAFNINGVTTSAQDLYKIMLENGYKPGTNIRLISCNAGKGVAQELSNLSNATVIAPTAKTKVDDLGKLITNDNSKYQVFTPNNQ